MKTRPEMTDEEIRSHMDFDRLLEMHRQTSVSRNFLDIKYLLIYGLIVSVGIFSWVLLKQPKRETQQGERTEIKKSDEQVVKKQSLITDSIAEPTVSNRSVENKELSLKRDAISRQPENKKNEKNAEQIVQAGDEKKTEVTATPNTPKPAAGLVYVQATPVNGYPDLYEYFNRELKYPQEAIKDSITGEVTAVFTINSEGLPEMISIENSLGSAFDREVIRLITNMPTWKPATYNDKAVPSKMSLPLTFQIKKIPSQK